jgi:hypothetical protein
MLPAGAPGADGGPSCCVRDGTCFGLQSTNAVRRQTPRPLISDLYIANICASRPALYAAVLEAKLPRHHLPADAFGPEPPLCNSWQWDVVWPDGDMLGTGWGGQGLYVSSGTEIVIAYFDTRTPRGETACGNMRAACGNFLRRAERCRLALYWLSGMPQDRRAKCWCNSSRPRP